MESLCSKQKLIPHYKSIILQLKKKFSFWLFFPASCLHYTIKRSGYHLCLASGISLMGCYLSHLCICLHSSPPFLVLLPSFFMNTFFKAQFKRQWWGLLWELVVLSSHPFESSCPPPPGPLCPSDRFPCCPFPPDHKLLSPWPMSDPTLQSCSSPLGSINLCWVDDWMLAPCLRRGKRWPSVALPGEHPSPLSTAAGPFLPCGPATIPFPAAESSPHALPSHLLQLFLQPSELLRSPLYVSFPDWLEFMGQRDQMKYNFILGQSGRVCPLECFKNSL